VEFHSDYLPMITIFAVVLSVTIALSALLVACWRGRRVLVVPLLPIGDADEDWERVDFTRVDGDGKEDTMDSSIQE